MFGDDREIRAIRVRSSGRDVSAGFVSAAEARRILQSEIGAPAARMPYGIAQPTPQKIHQLVHDVVRGQASMIEMSYFF